MKTIRSLMTLAGLSLVLSTLGATGLKAQVLVTKTFSGTFHLPYDAHWGKMTLPAGDYNLQFGKQLSGDRLVVVRGTAKGSQYGVILAGAVADTSASKNAIVCIRDGNALIVRALDMPAIGEAVTFTMPRSTTLAAHNGKHSGYTQLAEAPLLLQRIPVMLNAK